MTPHPRSGAGTFSHVAVPDRALFVGPPPRSDRALAPPSRRVHGRATPRRGSPLNAATFGSAPDAATYGSFLARVPVFWLLGLLTPLAALTLVRLAIARWPRGPLVNAVVACWLGIGGAQAVASVLNGVARGEPGKGVASAIGFGVLGWAFGALAIAVGASHRLDDDRVTRGTAKLGLYVLALAALAGLYRLAGAHHLELGPTPASLLLPHAPSIDFYTSALVFQTEETLGEATTRLVLFFPWATGLGLGGIAITFISLCDPDRRWRLIGAVGGLTGVVFSWSRIAIATTVAVGALLLFLRLPRLVRYAVIGALGIGLFALACHGIDPFAQIATARSAANEARAGSSLARDLIYQRSWEAFLRSPLIGYGWVGPSVHRIEPLPIGSHSSVYGLLYTGGLPTFACFALALAATLLALCWKLARCPRTDRRRRDHALVALGLALSLVAYCPYEALYNLTLPCVFLFTWIGSALATPTTPVPAAVAPRAARAAPRPSVERALAPPPFALRRSTA